MALAIAGPAEAQTVTEGFQEHEREGRGFLIVPKAVFVGLVFGSSREDAASGLCEARQRRQRRGGAFRLLPDPVPGAPEKESAEPELGEGSVSAHCRNLLDVETRPKL